MSGMLVEVESSLAKKVDGALDVLLLLQVEAEVELPGGCIWRKLSILVGERESDLNDVKLINVALDRLVEELLVVFKAENYSRILRVLSRAVQSVFRGAGTKAT
eukprot:TRINITY_DN2036_c0_g1_i1.p2 TRINITY_DN2036_c0_g1~~TRINITY_DN2036_c0_g1_i1.p2  ORF type:complete len:104 (-),score=25.70 TRINITY_DN2036_c0_g1_i1:204-515(-)